MQNLSLFGMYSFCVKSNIALGFGCHLDFFDRQKKKKTLMAENQYSDFDKWNLV